MEINNKTLKDHLCSSTFFQINETCLKLEGITIFMNTGVFKFEFRC